MPTFLHVKHQYIIHRIIHIKILVILVVKHIQ